MSTPPALHYEDWRALHGLNPWHAWQWHGPVDPGSCGVTYEYGWQGQSNAAGRSEVRAAIQAATAMIDARMGVPLVGSPVASSVDVLRPWTTPATIMLPVTPILALGHAIYSETATIPVTYADRDGDGVLDTWNATPPVIAGIALEHLFAVVPVDERVTPLLDLDRDTLAATITSDGATLTISGPAWSMARPLVTQIGQILDVQTVSNYLPTITLVARTFSADPLTHAASCTCIACTAPIAATLQNRDLGTLCLSGCGCGDGRYVHVAYTAGLAWKLDVGWLAAVGHLATAVLDAPICACEDVNRALYRWQQDLARTDTNTEQFAAISSGDLQNPFGTRRGAIAAYRYLLMTQPLGGVAAG